LFTRPAYSRGQSAGVLANVALAALPGFSLTPKIVAYSAAAALLTGAVIYGWSHLRQPNGRTRATTLKRFRQIRAEGGLHRTTAGRAFANSTDEELLAFSMALLKHRMMPAVDDLKVLKAVRSRSKEGVIAFLYETDPTAVIEAAARGADVLMGPVLSDDVLRALRQRFPHVLVLYEVGHADRSTAGWEFRPAENVENDIENAERQGVDGLVLKPFLGGGAAWPDHFPEGALSVQKLMERHPQWAIVGAGGIFETAFHNVFARFPGLIAAVGFNTTTLPDFERQANDYRQIEGVARLLAGERHPANFNAPFQIYAWARLSIDEQRRRLAAIAAAIEKADNAFALRVDVALAQGEPVRFSIVERGRTVHRGDPFQSFVQLLEDQLRTMDAAGERFFKVMDDGRTIDVFRSDVPGTGLPIDYGVNLDLLSKPGAGRPSPECHLCPAVIQNRFPAELWLRWGALNYYFNPYSIFAPTEGAPPHTMPYHLVAAWNGAHRPQADASSVEFLRLFRRQWLVLNDSPSLSGQRRFRLMVNGGAYGLPDVHGGASQDHVHGHLVRYAAPSEVARIEWKRDHGRGVRQGVVELLPAVESAGEGFYAFVFESPRNASSLDHLDRVTAATLDRITQNGSSFNIFGFETDEGLVRWYVAGRKHSFPPGSRTLGTVEALMRYFIIVSDLERFYDFTPEQRAVRERLSGNALKTWLKDQFGQGRLNRRAGLPLYLAYVSDLRHVLFERAEYDRLLDDPMTFSKPKELAPGLRMRSVAYKAPGVAASGEVFHLDLTRYQAVQRYAENVRTRDVFDPPLELHEDALGRVAEDFFLKDSSLATPDLVVNTTQGHFYDPNSLMVVEGKVLVREPGRRGMNQERSGYAPLSGRFSVISLDGQNPGIFEVSLEKGHPTAPLPVENGFAGVRLLENRESRIDRIQFNGPAVTGDAVGWKTLDQRLAFTVFGYNRARPSELIIVQTMGDPSNANEQEMDLNEVVELLRRAGVTDAILGGTSGDVTRYSPLLNPPVLQANARPGSRFQAYASRREDGRRRVGMAVGFFPRLHHQTPPAPDSRRFKSQI
jgi:hypothetical protein